MSSERPLQVPFRRLVPEAGMHERAHLGVAGYDLRSVERMDLAPGSRALVRTGISVAIPEGYAGLVLPRSGLAARHGIALVNSPGLIDSGYRGEVRVLLLNTDRARPFEVLPGDRIAQLLVTPLAGAEPVEAVDPAELAGSALVASSVSDVSPVRGERGFGSSGR